MADVFISYSRRDAEFVRRLQSELESRGKEVWVDVEGIRDAEVFPEVLLRAIESSDAFVFVITPDAVRSPFCQEEVEHALALNKRVVPLLLRSVPDPELPEGIRVRNWIPIGNDEFGRGVLRLLTAVDTDLEWERQHSRLTVKALEWEQSGRDRSFLLRGSELAAAEQWLAAAAERESGANAIEQEYLLAGRLARSRRQPGFVAAVSFGRGGRTLLVAGDRVGPKPRGWLRIWRLGAKPTIAHELTGGPPLYTWATFSPDGRFVAATGTTAAQLGSPYKGGGLVTEWNASARLVSPPVHLAGGGLAIDVGFARHGPTVAVTQLNNRVEVVDPARHAVVARWQASHTLQADGAALSPSGQSVATVDFDGFLREWHASDGKSTAPPIRASESAAWSVNWSPDGSRLVIAGSDGTVRIYDARGGQQIGTSLPMPGEQQVNDPYAIYSQDGRTIAATDATGRVWLYRAGLRGWEAYACQLADRNLTRAEWAKLVPGQPYRQMCPAGS